MIVLALVVVISGSVIVIVGYFMRTLDTAVDAFTEGSDPELKAVFRFSIFKAAKKRPVPSEAPGKA